MWLGYLPASASHTMCEVLHTMCCARILCVLFLELLELLPVQWVGGVLLYGLVGNARLQRPLERPGALSGPKGALGASELAVSIAIPAWEALGKFLSLRALCARCAPPRSCEAGRLAEEAGSPCGPLLKPSRPPRSAAQAYAGSKPKALLSEEEAAHVLHIFKRASSD